MRLVGLVEQMLNGLADVFRNGDVTRAAQIGRMDSVLDRLGINIRNYLADIGGEEHSMRRTEARSQEIWLLSVTWSTSAIWHRRLIEFAAKRVSRGPGFPRTNCATSGQCAHVMESLRLGLSVFLHNDVRASQQLVEEERYGAAYRKCGGGALRAAAEEQQRIPTAMAATCICESCVISSVSIRILAACLSILERAGLLQNRLVCGRRIHHPNGKKKKKKKKKKTPSMARNRPKKKKKKKRLAGSARVLALYTLTKRNARLDQ